MTVFIFLIAFTFIGIGVVLLLLKGDKEEDNSVEKIDPQELRDREGFVNLVGLSAEDRKKEALKKQQTQTATPKKSLFGFLKKKPNTIPLPKKEKPVRPDKPEKKKFTLFSKAAQNPSSSKELPKTSTPEKPKKAKSASFSSILGKFAKKNKNDQAQKLEDVPKATSFDEFTSMYDKVDDKKVNSHLADHPTPDSKISRGKPPQDFKAEAIDPSEIRTLKNSGMLTDDESEELEIKSNTSSGPTANEQKAPPQHQNISSEEERFIEKEVNTSLELNELKEKHKTLENLLKEKTEALDKSETNLKNEQKNRKDFNKVKDILEKELSDTKDRAKKLQSELNLLKTDNDNFRKHIERLESTITELKENPIPTQPVPEMEPQTATEEPASQIAPTDVDPSDQTTDPEENKPIAKDSLAENQASEDSQQEKNLSVETATNNEPLSIDTSIPEAPAGTQNEGNSPPHELSKDPIQAPDEMKPDQQDTIKETTQPEKHPDSKEETGTSTKDADPAGSPPDSQAPKPQSIGEPEIKKPINNELNINLDTEKDHSPSIDYRPDPAFQDDKTEGTDSRSTLNNNIDQFLNQSKQQENQLNQNKEESRSKKYDPDNIEKETAAFKNKLKELSLHPLIDDDDDSGPLDHDDNEQDSDDNEDDHSDEHLSLLPDIFSGKKFQKIDIEDSAPADEDQKNPKTPDPSHEDDQDPNKKE
ncbi:MAG: hypothetical protein KC713_02460 [Candidatus Omnitrophica bacterium]|nr:hypothetical protein [Candidatus Omnitrophota bacterium]